MAKITTSALGRLFKKIKRYDSNSYGGQFTPTEIFYLIDLGAQFSQDSNWIKEHKDKGDSSPHWFYFQASKKLREHSMWEKVIKNNIPR